ncbi:MAG: 30S ribosomal protein S17 [Bdellovibrionales bacterium]|nr:30S ribosomal protein S17 [Bdellovibrionales bacterium]
MEAKEVKALVEEVNKKKQPKRGLPKTREGVVVSDKMEKSLVVSTVRLMKHPAFKKYVRVTKKFHVHDERNEAKIGDRVQIVETRPLSKTKRWRLLKIVEKAV